MGNLKKETRVLDISYQDKLLKFVIAPCYIVFTVIDFIWERHVSDVCILLVYGTTSLYNLSLTFRHDILLPSSRIEILQKNRH